MKHNAMWRVTLLLLLALLCFSACGAPAARELPACEQVVAAVRASQSFTEEQTQLSQSKAAKLLLLEEGQYTDLCLCMDASRATAELAVAVTAADQAQADAVAAALQAYLDSLTNQYRDYQPKEMPKLEAAQVLRQGFQCVLVVCPDQAKAQSAVKGLW